MNWRDARSSGGLILGAEFRAVNISVRRAACALRKQARVRDCAREYTRLVCTTRGSVLHNNTPTRCVCRNTHSACVLSVCNNTERGRRSRWPPTGRSCGENSSTLTRRSDWIAREADYRTPATIDNSGFAIALKLFWYEITALCVWMCDCRSVLLTHRAFNGDDASRRHASRSEGILPIIWWVYLDECTVWCLGSRLPMFKLWTRNLIAEFRYHEMEMQEQPYQRARVSHHQDS